MSELTRRLLLSLLFVMLPLNNANATTNIVKIATGFDGVPFLLDDRGLVWSFHGDPFAERQDVDPFQLNGLKDIVDIAPYAAVRKDGKVLVWRLAAIMQGW